MSNVKKSNQNSVPASNSQKLPAADEMKKLYRDMLLIRRFEEKAGQLYGMGLIGGFCHLYIGEEAVVTGVQSVQKKQDTTITAYRNHGHMLVSGISANEVMAELTGRAGGCSRGKGGSMHMFDAANGMHGGYGIIGGHIPLAAGIAFASKYKEDGGVTLCFFGDGAVPIAGFHEGIGLAALWKLPIVFICENNEYSMGTPLSRTLMP